MNVLGIDPGLASIGWAVLEFKSGFKLIECGCFKTKKGEDFSSRLAIIFEEIKKLAEKYDLEVLAKFTAEVTAVVPSERQKEPGL